MRHLLILLSVFVLFSCEDGTTRDRVSNTPSGSTAGDPDLAIDDRVTEIVAIPLEITQVYVEGTNGQSCTDFSVQLLGENDEPVTEAKVFFSIVTDTSVEDSGLLVPELATSNEQGIATTKYCAGKSQLSLTINGKINQSTVNSDKISVTTKGVFQFTYLSASVGSVKDEGGGNQEEIILLNLYDSGPQDCSTLFFQLSKEDTPVAGTELVFSTQYDPPRGLKLAKKIDDGEFEKQEGQNNTRAIFKASSSKEGKFSIPVCAGVALGTAVVSASFEDEDGNLIKAKSPVISVRGGLTNYANFSLTFNFDNARTLKGFFNNNSNHVVNVKVKTNSTQDGESIGDHPLTISSETGKIRLLNGGSIDESGHAEFSIEALHMIDNYAFRVYPFIGFPEAASRCDPAQIAASLAGNPAGFAYSNLAKNWRSTVAYSIRGQEFFYDLNRNGIYDGNGDGFWDKNLNGVFDGNDVLTYDFNNNGTFDYAGEWFIDQPTPFVDSDENGIFNGNIDILLGETYVAPNGVRDVDVNIWKHEYFPIYMGTSNYSLLRSRIQSNYTLMDNTITAYPQLGRVFASTIDGTEIFSDPNDANITKQESTISKHFFAHGACGNLLPGRTKLNFSFEDFKSAAFGIRSVSAYFKPAPGDDVREASRHFLIGNKDDPNPDGRSSAMINFNAVDHPMKEFGYPVGFNLVVPECSNPCTGAVVGPANPVACDAASVDVIITIEEPKELNLVKTYLRSRLSIPETKACTCATGAQYAGGICSCPTGTEFNGAACVAS